MKSFMGLFGVTVIAIACGGGSGGGGGALTAEQAEPICKRGCEHDIACGSTSTLEECTNDCIAQLAGWARRDAFEQLVDCVTMVACDGNDDACFEAIRPLAIHQEWEDKCRADFAACLSPAEVETACEVDPQQGASSSWVFIASPVMREIIDCLDEADCETRFSCINAVADKYGIDL